MHDLLRALAQFAQQWTRCALSQESIDAIGHRFHLLYESNWTRWRGQNHCFTYSQWSRDQCFPLRICERSFTGCCVWICTTLDWGVGIVTWGVWGGYTPALVW